MIRFQILLILLPCFAFAQADSNTDDQLLTAQDSLSIFQLLDSLINLEPVKYSQLAFRAGYTSNINAAGAPFELGQFGLTTKAAFYHKSGLFLDATGYGSNQYNPKYYLTVATLGYMNSNYRKWSFLLEYSRYFYNIQQTSLPVSIIYTYNDNYSSQSFRNCFSAAVYFEHKNLIFKQDYTLYTGDRTGHRFNPSITYSLRKNNWLGIDRISFLPTISVLIGIEQVPYFKKLYNTRLGGLIRIRNHLPLFSEELQTEFGVMNYAMRFPVTTTEKNWSFNITYTYNFPNRLPGEIANISNGGSLALSVVKYLNLKPH